MNRFKKGTDYEREVNRLFGEGWTTRRSMLSRGTNDAYAEMEYSEETNYDQLVREIFESDGYTVTENKQKNFQSFKMRARKINRENQQRTTYYSIVIDVETGTVFVRMQMKKNKLKR